VDLFQWGAWNFLDGFVAENEAKALVWVRDGVVTDWTADYPFLMWVCCLYPFSEHSGAPDQQQQCISHLFHSHLSHNNPSSSHPSPPIL
jgi:hypothetical protein